MKRFYISVIALMLCVVLVGCGGALTLPEGFTLGTYDGQRYENTFLGLGCNLPEEFTYTPPEELGDMMDIGEDLSEQERNAAYASASTLYLIQANNVEGGGMGVSLENTKADGAEVTSAKEYLSTAKAELPSAMTSMGFSDVTVNEISLSIAGKEYNGLQAKGNMYEETFTQNYICFDKDPYLVIISYGAYDEAAVDTLTNSFYAL